MHFLLTNDDGIDADGLRALADAVRGIEGHKVTIVAPMHEHSMCGHRVTTREPLRVEHRGEGRHAASGTPADCVRLALHGLDIRPDFVLAGINHGGNMGQDLVISGTVAAVREAAYHGIPAAAFSHYIIRDVPFDWPRAAAWARTVLSGLLQKPLAAGEFWNVNLPHLPPGEMTMPEARASIPARSPLPVAYEVEHEHGSPHRRFRYSASYASRPADAGSDVEACFGGRIAVSKLSIAHPH